MISLQRPTSLPDAVIRLDLEIEGVKFALTLDRNLPTQRFIYDILDAGFCYEPESTRAIIGTLKPGETFFDVGANCGWFSAIAEAMGAEVLAWEPDAVNVAALRVNAPKARVIEMAASDTAGNVTLFTNLDNDGGHALWPCGVHPHNTSTAAAGNPNRTVRAAVLDAWSHHNPAILKIDTEGAECNVLLGAKAVLANPSLRMVICERHLLGLHLMHHSPEEIEAIMERHGFRCEQTEKQVTNVENWIFTR